MSKRTSATSKITCPVCGRDFRALTTQHIRKHGFQDAQEFKAHFGLEFLKCKEMRDSQSSFMTASNPTRGKGHRQDSIRKMKRNRSGKGKGVCGTYERTPEIRAKVSEGVTQAYLDGRLKGPRGRGDWVYSEKTRGVVWVRSSWEERVLVVLDKHPCVLEVVVEPFSIPYKFLGVEHNYIPDFLVTLEGNIQEVWEVKPLEFLDDPRVEAKIEALNEYLYKHGLNGRVVTLDQIEGMEMQVGIRPWEGPGGPWVSQENPDKRPTHGTQWS